MTTAERLAGLSAAERREVLAMLEPTVTRRPWHFTARPDQREPKGDWTQWLILSGRSWGKTRTGAETTNDRAARGDCKRISLVARTAADYRDTMIEGESGILACSPPDWRPVWEPSKRELTWPNGTIAKCYSAEEPGQLRGPQSSWFWADEFASWFVNSSEQITPQSTARAEKAWSNLMILNRLGDHPQGVITTTPQPLQQIRSLLADPNVYVTRGALFDNSANLSERYLERMRMLYDGTRLGRQELYGEILDDVPGALWQREWFDRDRQPGWPDLVRVVVGVDPAVTSGPDADETGIVVAGLGVDGRGYVIADRSCKLSPQGWAERALRAYHDFRADSIIPERNNGGDLVMQNIRLVGPHVPVMPVWASRGKAKRAEPIALLYEKAMISHVGQYDQMEDEMCRFTREGGFDLSPNRADAAVWALWALFLDGRDYVSGAVGVEDADAVRISSV